MFMADKLPVVMCFICAGIFIALWPMLALYCSFNKYSRSSYSTVLLFNRLIFIFLIFLIGTGLFGLGTATIPKLIIAFVLILLTVVVSQGRMATQYILAIMCGLIVSATLPWWRRNPWPILDLSFKESLWFLGVTLGVILALERKAKEDKFPAKYQWVAIIQISLFLVFVFSLSLSIGLSSSTKWHHWGAYIAPAELLLAGARIFYDFPAQYGLGATLLIASVCGENCFNGMYFIVGLSTIIFSSLIAFIALYFVKSVSKRWIILILVIACCFGWTGSAAPILLPSTYPSTGGLRFLPVLILVSLLIRLDKELFRAMAASSKTCLWVGHAAWIFAFLWSPESAFYATFVWWPYYVFIRSAGAVGNREMLVRSAVAVFVLMILFSFTVFLFLFAYWMVYRAFPDFYAYFAYVLNPPGPMPIAPKGVVWFFVMVMLLSVSSSYRTFRRYGNSNYFRIGYLLSLMAYSSFSYFLGRSHENNMLNLMPFLFLVLLHVYSVSEVGSWQRGGSVVLIATLLGWTSVFGFPRIVDLFNFSPGEFKSTIADSIERRENIDANNAIAYVKEKYNEPITVIDRSLNLSSTDSRSIWSSINNPANFVFVPSVHRREFISRTAVALDRKGWLLISSDYRKQDWLSDFDAAYVRTRQVDYGGYLLIRYEPRH